MANWLLNDSAPTTLAQEFETPPAEWVEVYWGGPSSMLFTAGAPPVTVTPLRMLMGVGLALFLALVT